MKKKGKGIACMYYPVGSTGKPNASGAFIKMHNDGTVMVSIGAVDEGQGSTTAMTQIVAEELGIAFERIRMISADTELTPFDYGTGACRVTYVQGNAVKKTAESVKKMLQVAAAAKLNVINPDRLILKDGKITLEGFSEISMSISEAAFYSERVLGKPIMAAESFTPTTFPIDPETGHGRPYEAYVYATQIAEVEVDIETGEVDVLKLVAVHDCGQAINPMMVEGQIEGGAVMGLGYALMEDLLEDGRNGGVINNSFVDYYLPTAADIPNELIVDFVEQAEKNGPFGAKGMAEPTQLPTAPAIINAIYDAVGVRIYDLPATPEKVLRALKQKYPKNKIS